MTEQYEYWRPDVGWLVSREQLGCPILHIILYCLHRWGVVTQGENIPRLGSYTSIMQHAVYNRSVICCNLFVLLTFLMVSGWLCSIYILHKLNLNQTQMKLLFKLLILELPVVKVDFPPLGSLVKCFLEENLFNGCF